MKPIVTDVYDFPTLIEGGYVYVDKTAYLRRMVSGVDGRLFFMSRPRRFGKSLMISTLEQIFKGNRRLFRGLAIDKSDYAWKKYPIVRLDMSVVHGPDVQGCRLAICSLVRSAAHQFGCDLGLDGYPGLMFSQLIEHVASCGEKVVVLIDEYDAPLDGLLSNPKLLEEVRTLLHDFYVVLKARSADIRFLMMTGVSKFSKLSVFSGLNNLTDLSMRPEYAELLGYTSEELDMFFSGHIGSFAKSMGKTRKAAKSALLSWYDSYRFSPQSEAKVCNPVSVGRALVEKKLEGFWSATGNATLIIERLRKAGKLPEELEGIESGTDELSACDSRLLPIVPLLYQGGYLTIKSVRPGGRLLLGIPNREVRMALNRGVLVELFKDESSRYISIAESLISDLDSSADATEVIRKTLTSVFAMVPHEWKLKNEAEAKRYFLLFMRMAGATIHAEVESAGGRADAVLETQKSVYIFEFKYGQSAKAALKQCHARNYAASYASDNRQVVCVGVNYDTIKRKVDTLSDTLSDTLNDTLNSRVMALVRQRPGLRRPDLMAALGVSESTVARSLRELKAEVEFRGAPKTGGYFLK